MLFRWRARHVFSLVFPTRNGTQQTQRNALRDFKLIGKQLGIGGVRFRVRRCAGPEAGWR